MDEGSIRGGVTVRSTSRSDVFNANPMHVQVGGVCEHSGSNLARCTANHGQHSAPDIAQATSARAAVKVKKARRGKNTVWIGAVARE